MLAILTAALVAAAASTNPFDDAQTFRLKMVPTGVSKRLGGYMPQRVTLSDAKPDTIKKLPEGVKDARFGTIPIAGGEGATYHLVLVEPSEGEAKLWIDSNGDGDLTNDAAVEWKGKTNDDGFTMYSGSNKVDLGAPGKTREAGLNFYRFDKNDDRRAALKDTILFYRDYGAEAEIKLGDATYPIMLVDERATGDFRGKELDPDEPRSSSGVMFMIDRNGDGEFARRGEQFDSRKPFNIAGTTYELADVAKDGMSLAIKKSDKSVDEIKLAPNHKVGQSITPFEATTMAGKALKFPGDYKGKIVLLDFWATWCGPCVGELPNVVEAYNQFHDTGFEILGISLDREKAESKIHAMEKDKGMTWPQVYDGNYWKARVADLYAIDSIPATFLVDGDSGKIIGTNLRGEALAEAVAKALEGKKPQ